MASVRDALVVGGGLVGLTTACLLRRAVPGLSVALVEPAVRKGTGVGGGGDEQEEGRPTLIPDARQSTLSLGSQRVMEAVGAWSGVSATATPVKKMQVWAGGGEGRGGGRGGVLMWDCGDVGRKAMAYAVENDAMVGSLREAAVRMGVEIIEGRGVKGMQLPDADTLGGGAPAVVELDKGGEEIRTRLVVGADGGASACRQLAGLTRPAWERDYDQRAVVAVVRTSPTNIDTAWQIFNPGSEIVALLPSRDGWSSVVWSTCTARARELESLGAPEFCRAMNAALSPAPPPPGRPAPEIVEASGSARSFPLRARHNGQYIRARLALVGDAAHTVHPLAGQGVNLGLADAAALAKHVSRAVMAGQEPGDPMLLREYGVQRRRANDVMMRTIDGLHMAFRAEDARFSATRNWGMNVLNSLPPVKNRAMLYAMGEQMSL